jgi:hypothetical protein
VAKKHLVIEAQVEVESKNEAKWKEFYHISVSSA